MADTPRPRDPLEESPFDDIGDLNAAAGDGTGLGPFGDGPPVGLARGGTEEQAFPEEDLFGTGLVE